jgi:hypothetical protein
VREGSTRGVSVERWLDRLQQDCARTVGDDGGMIVEIEYL